MDNKKTGIMLVIFSLIIGLLVFSFNQTLQKNIEADCSCDYMENGLSCPAEHATPWQTYAGIIFVSLVAALGIYMLFFEKSQKEIIQTLKKQKIIRSEKEKFEILLKGLNSEEKKVIKSVKEQQGITQQTLRLRTDLHKSKLSIVLDGLEKKGLVKRESSKKTKKVFLKIKL